MFGALQFINKVVLFGAGAGNCGLLQYWWSTWAWYLVVIALPQGCGGVIHLPLEMVHYVPCGEYKIEPQLVVEGKYLCSGVVAREETR